MRIGVDASHLRWLRTGIGAYVDGLLHALEASLGDGDEMVAFYNSLPGPRLFGPGVRERHVRMQGSLAWNQVAVPLALLRDHCDVYLGSANLVPVATRVPRVMVVHDCKAFRFPKAGPPRWVRYMRRWMRLSARHAVRLVAVSRWVAAECEEFLGVPPARITVIHQGIDSRFRPATPEEAAADRLAVRRLGVRAPFVLQVGAFERHKGGEVALAAMARLVERGRELTLVRCGLNGVPAATPFGMDLGYVTDSDLLGLYRSAEVVCVASRHEGFGRPAVEAMACGTPVVASDIGGLREAAGDAALLVPPGDADALSEGLARLLDDPEAARRHREAGFDQAARFRWDVSAAAMRRVLDDVARGASPSDPS